VSFWDIIWFIIVSFVFVAYLMTLFSILVDVFRDREVSGVKKAVWLFFLIFFPLVTALVYLVVRGDGMARRQEQSARQVVAAQEAYIASVAGATSPADQIERAKVLLDAGTITSEEYARLKAKALA
jgi:uncharacterized membrane protein YhaH (DUF805 family)